MSLETLIMQDLKTAMKAKDQAALRSVRAIKAAILLLKTDGSGQELNEEKEIKRPGPTRRPRQEGIEQGEDP